MSCNQVISRRRRLTNGPERRKRGSVLVPVVAAMLILSLCGAVLAELFSAQRIQAVLIVESSRALWIAEAGLRHAAHAGTDIAVPVTFAGGNYTVEKVGHVYTATGRFSKATRVVSLDYSSISGVPVDESGSVGTAIGTDDEFGKKKKLHLSLVSASPVAGVIASFALSADVATEQVKKLKLDDEEIWKQDHTDLPTGTLALNKGSLAERTLPGGSTLPFMLEFEDEPSGSVEYTLVLFFTDGSSSTLIFTIDW